MSRKSKPLSASPTDDHDDNGFYRLPHVLGKPDADAFVRECAQLFLGEADDAPAAP